jgi:hypothetical protein
MSVMQAMGLENEQVLNLLVERWPQWCSQVPDLQLLAEPANIDAWRRAAPAGQVDLVLRGLAQLASKDGGDDLDAARVLAWLLMPVAVRLSAELVEFDPDIDEHIAACLWIEVRTARWRSRARLTSNLAWRLRRQVCIELGDRARIDTHRDRTLARTLIDDEIARTEQAGVDLYELDVRDELLAVLEWGRDLELITEADCQLLVDVVAAADTPSRPGCRHSAALLGDDVSDRVAARWGVSGRTVRRHARRSITALAGAVSEGQAAALRRIA